MSDIAAAAIDAALSSPPAAPVSDAPAPYTVLGHDEGVYYFMSRRGGQVLKYRARDLGTHATLFEIADSAFWTFAYPKKGGEIDLRAATEDLMNQARAVGVFDPGRIRGRGAWLDGEDVLFHMGDRIICNGASVPPQQRAGRFVYPMRQAFATELAEPLSNREAGRLLELCCALNFDNADANGRLLAGWLVSALACGAMPWRPHLWVTGENGSGKTWLMDNVIEATLGAIALRVDGTSTEPFIRRELGGDARPVIFDEPDTQTRADQQRVQAVINLARHSSSEAGAKVGKASTSGDGVNRAHVRSSFCFSSINVGMTQAADLARTVILTCRKAGTKEEQVADFAKLRRMQAEIITPDFSARLLARTLRLVPVIRANVGTFARAIAATGGQRMGDTLGVMIAGAWSLTSDKLVTDAEAAAIVARNQWIASVSDSATVTPEWRQALDWLLQARAEVAPGNARPERFPVGELIDMAAAAPRDREALAPAEVAQALARFGISLADGMVRFANTSTAIKTAYAGSPWEDAWKTTLQRADGAERSGKGTARFGRHLVSAFVAVPLRVVMGT